MYGKDLARVGSADNGYTVCINDPAVVKANKSRSDKSPWRDPERTYVFQTLDEVLEFLKNNLDKAVPEDDYSSSFNAAVAADD